jgi:carbon-monoxide dehydrogenase medium subunit
MSSFAYERPVALEAALDAMSGASVAALAGGTDFVPMYRSCVMRPEKVVDLKRVEGLDSLTVDETGLAVGATVTMRRVTELSEPWVAALADGAEIVGGPMTRNRATIGGNVCRSSPAGDTLPPLLVLGAKMALASADARRDVPVERFFSGPGQNISGPDELLLAIKVGRRGGASAYQRLTYRRWMDLAVVGVSAWVELDDDARCVDAAVAFGGAAPTARLVPEAADVLRGSELDAEAVAAAAAEVQAAARPIADVRGSVDHRLRGLQVLTRRVVQRAAERARRVTRGD